MSDEALADVPDDQYVAPGDREWSRPWQQPFLLALSSLPDVSAACRIARISKQSVYQCRAKDPDFAEAFREARLLARDFVQRQLHEWGTVGVPSVETRTTIKTDAAGKVIETTTVKIERRERNVAALIFYLKAWYPERYRETARVEHSGEITTLTEATPEQEATAVRVLSSTVTRIADARRARERAAGGGTG